MGPGYRRGFTSAERTEMWDRWQRGESLSSIDRAFGKEAVLSSGRGTKLPPPSARPDQGQFPAGLGVVGCRARGAARDGEPPHDQTNLKHHEIADPCEEEPRDQRSEIRWGQTPRRQARPDPGPARTKNGRDDRRTCRCDGLAKTLGPRRAEGHRSHGGDRPQCGQVISAYRAGCPTGL